MQYLIIQMWTSKNRNLCFSRESQVALLVKNPPANTGDVRDTVLIPGSGRFPAIFRTSVRCGMPFDLKNDNHGRMKGKEVWNHTEGQLFDRASESLRVSRSSRGNSVYWAWIRHLLCSTGFWKDLTCKVIMGSERSSNALLEVPGQSLHLLLPTEIFYPERTIS